jgi:hypothetical protein
MADFQLKPIDHDPFAVWQRPEGRPSGPAPAATAAHRWAGASARGGLTWVQDGQGTRAGSAG